MEQQRGRVKWFDQDKNYGFIESESDGKKREFFVHKSDVVQGSLEKGQRVQFEVGEGKKGPVARNVSGIDEEEE